MTLEMAQQHKGSIEESSHLPGWHRFALYFPAMEMGDRGAYNDRVLENVAGDRLRILLVEPTYGGSRRAFVENLIAYSRHEIVPLTLPARFWKWRMRGAHYELARLFEAMPGSFDIVLAGEMLNLPAFLGMTRDRLRNARAIAYFDTNQLSFPLPPWE
jgi:hypothetical protein